MDGADTDSEMMKVPEATLAVNTAYREDNVRLGEGVEMQKDTQEKALSVAQCVTIRSLVYALNRTAALTMDRMEIGKDKVGRGAHASI